MNQQIFSKFNQYDLFGYLMVGSVASLIILFDAAFFYGASLPSFNLETLIVWFIIAYFVGSAVQGFVNLLGKFPLIQYFVKEDKEKYSEDNKVILEEARKYFKRNNKVSDSYLWNICYLFVVSKDEGGQIAPFSSYYSLYRGWLVVFLFETIFVFFMFLINNDLTNLGILLVSLLLFIVFYTRSKRFWGYLTNKVLQMFIAIKQ